jgi:hypothetical protein
MLVVPVVSCGNDAARLVLSARATIRRLALPEMFGEGKPETETRGLIQMIDACKMTNPDKFPDCHVCGGHLYTEPKGGGYYCVRCGLTRRIMPNGDPLDYCNPNWIRKGTEA